MPESAMEEADILVQIISNIIKSAKSAGLGNDAVKIANHVSGLTVNPDGGITITGNALQILGDLIGEYEKAMKAKLSTEVKVILHLIKYAHVTSGPKDG